MSKNNRQNFERVFKKLKGSLGKRLEKKGYSDQPSPIMTASNIHYELSEKSRAMAYGGIGIIHAMVKALSLDKAIDSSLELLKVHLPYHESDHVLNIAYNVLVGGVRLEDIELRRNDESYLNALGAERIPDPTTAGDFTRRFEEQNIITLMDTINDVRIQLWSKLAEGKMKEGIIDVDGTFAPTLG